MALSQALNIQVTIPDQETPFFVQLQSSASLSNLKSHIFRKIPSLSAEKSQGFVLATQIGNKMEILSEDKKILQSNRAFEEQQRSGKLLSLHLLRKESPAVPKKKDRDSSSSPALDRMIIRKKKNRLSTDRHQPQPQPQPSEDTKNNVVSSDRFHFTRFPSAQQFAHDAFPQQKEPEPRKAPMVRSKSEPTLHRNPTRSCLTDTFTETESMDGAMMSSSSSVDSLSEDDDEVFDPTRLSPRTSQRDMSMGGKVATLVRPDGNIDVKKNKKSSWIIFGREKFHNSPPVELKSAAQAPSNPNSKQITIKLDSMAAVATPDLLSPKMEVVSTAASSEPQHPRTPTIFSPPTPPANRLGSTSEGSATSRKVTELHPRASAFYSNKHTNPGLQVEVDADKPPVITAGTFEELINCLADRDIPDITYLDEFFYSLTYFSNCQSVIQHLQSRFDYLPPPNSPTEVVDSYNQWRLAIQQRVLHAIRYLLENHWYHFERDPRLLGVVKSLIESGPVRSNTRSRPLRELLSLKEGLMNNDGTLSGGTVRRPGIFGASNSPPLGYSSPDGAGNSSGIGSQDLSTHGRSTSSPIISWKPRSLTSIEGSGYHSATAPNLTMGSSTTDILASSLPSSVNTIIGPSNAPPKILGKKYKDFRKISFMKLHPVELARQLTLIESEMFRSIAPLELTASAWKKKNKAEIAPSVVRMIDWFNKMTAWIATEIVMTPNIKERALVLSRFMQVADSCWSMNNFNTAMEILSALNMVCVKRLYKTWKLLSKKEAERFTELEDFMLPKANYHKYRQAVADAQASKPPAPVLPYIGVVLQDLLMIEELPTYLPAAEGTPVFINFRKMRRFTSVLRAEILEKQARVYSFQQIPALQEYLMKGIFPAAEADLYKNSRLCEPSNLV